MNHNLHSIAVIVFFFFHWFICCRRGFSPDIHKGSIDLLKLYWKEMRAFQCGDFEWKLLQSDGHREMQLKGQTGGGRETDEHMPTKAADASSISADRAVLA